MIQNEKITQKLVFVHANGFPPNSYKILFEKLLENFSINNFLLRPLWDNKQDYKLLKDWSLFYNDFNSFMEDNNHNNTIGIGHSIGGNILLRTAIDSPKYFSKIILLDPILFTPIINNSWKIVSLLKLQNRIHPLSKGALNRKMSYNTFDDIFKSYRRKSIFKNIDDLNLKIYIKSITKETHNGLEIIYSNLWENKIYNTGLLKDNYIWKHIKNLKIPCLIIRADNSNAFLDSSKNKISKLNQNILFKTIQNSTHLFPLEYPDKSFNLINDFLSN